MKTEEEVKKEILEAIRDGVTYSPQLDSLVVHGAVDRIYQMMEDYRNQDDNLHPAIKQFLDSQQPMSGFSLEVLEETYKRSLKRSPTLPNRK